MLNNQNQNRQGLILSKKSDPFKMSEYLYFLKNKINDYTFIHPEYDMIFIVVAYENHIIRTQTQYINKNNVVAREELRKEFLSYSRDKKIDICIQ